LVGENVEPLVARLPLLVVPLVYDVLLKDVPKATVQWAGRPSFDSFALEAVARPFEAKPARLLIYPLQPFLDN
jgi:hypothetical protein